VYAASQQQPSESPHPSSSERGAAEVPGGVGDEGRTTAWAGAVFYRDRACIQIRRFRDGFRISKLHIAGKRSVGGTEESAGQRRQQAGRRNHIRHVRAWT